MVGLAYFLTAVVAPLIILKLKGVILLFGLSNQRLAVVADCGTLGAIGALGVLLAFGNAQPRLCTGDHVDHFCGGSYG